MVKMNIFLGNIDAKVDIKGRSFIPAPFRKILQETGDKRLVLRKDTFQDCLVLYPESVWNEELLAMRTKLNKWDAAQQQLYRQFILDTEIVEKDSSGRILIPKRYLLMANISNELRFVGMDFTIEIWSKQNLEKSLLNNSEFINGIQKWMK
ncbi:transcriptional regulator MraZ [Bacteroidales bacterium]|nr:transcriptional regulator MraZ [Bacteroidales bacterium]